MRIDLSVAQKGLMLVCIPLFFELIFVGVLYAGLLRAEDLAKTERQSREVVARAHEMAHSLYEAAYMETQGNFMWKYLGDNRFFEKFDALVAEVPKRYERLEQLTANNQRQKAHVDRLKLPIDKLIYWLSSYKQKAYDNTQVLSNVQSFKGWSTNTNLVLKEIRNLTDEEEEIEESYAVKTEQSDKLIKGVLVVGIVFNVLLAVFLAFFFSRTITARLAVLTDNALRLAKRLPLNRPVTGSDEVSRLDRVFHQMADELRQAEQHKQEYVSMLGHDLKTPLASLRGSLALFGRGVYGELDDKGKHRALAAEQSVEMLLNLINELLEIEKIEAGMLQLDVRKVQLLPVAVKVIDGLQPLFEQHGVTVMAPDDDIELLADKDKLERVLMNLVSNAVKYSPQGSQVKISARLVPGWTEIRVTDQGRGIAKEAIGKIFDRFQQVDKQDEIEHGGTGLGLAICKGIVEAHKGEIGVESEPGKGSTFWLRLPRE